MNIHEWLNALHIIAGVLWTGGMLLMAVTYSVARSGAAGGHAALLGAVRRWNRQVTSPAMIVLWVAGIVMIVMYGQLPHAWLWLKMLVVLGLSAVHGILSGSLKRLANGEAARFAWLQNAAAITVAAVVVIVLLAILRPF